MNKLVTDLKSLEIETLKNLKNSKASNTLRAYQADFKDFSRSGLAIIMFLSNFYFLFKANYFDTPVEVKPLLHTWSLSIEEQYYLLFPF